MGGPPARGKLECCMGDVQKVFIARYQSRLTQCYFQLKNSPAYKNVTDMVNCRHGERQDLVDKNWRKTAEVRESLAGSFSAYHC